MYTSGTTGNPKGAQLTHRGVNAHSAACCTAMSVGPGNTALVAMPLFHVGGSSYAQVGIHGGAATILLREPAPAALFGAIASGATHTFVVPTIIHGVLAAGEQAVAAFGGLKSIAYGAAPMPLPMLRQALDAWPEADLVQVYGMTETSGVTTLLTAEAHRDSAHPERLASGGLPLPGVEHRVVDPVTLEERQAGGDGRDLVPLGPGDARLPQQARRPPPRRTPPTAGSAPATSGARTTRASSTSWTGSKT